MAYAAGPSSSSSSVANNAPSFLFSVQELRPNYDTHAPRYTPPSFASLWLPPNRKVDFRPRPLDTVDVPIYRWAGNVTEINRNTYPRATELNTRDSNRWTYGSYSVFVQQNNGSILAVDFDCRRKDVRDSDIAEWREIAFDHLPASSSVYSYLDAPGDYQHLAGGASTQAATWINQLFPSQYHWGPTVDASYPNLRHAGLIGRLPLIIALVALSCGRGQVRHVLTHCITPRRWIVHNAAHGRERERGVVVTVWRDPNNPASTNEALRELEDGRFGAFFGL